jgi:hypothetical protein
MNGMEPHKLEIPLAFLRANRRYVAHVYSDADPNDGTRTHVTIARHLVDRDTLVLADVPPAGGQAVRLVPATEQDRREYQEY